MPFTRVYVEVAFIVDTCQAIVPPAAAQATPAQTVAKATSDMAGGQCDMCGTFDTYGDREHRLIMATLASWVQSGQMSYIESADRRPPHRSLLRLPRQRLLQQRWGPQVQEIAARFLWGRSTESKRGV